MKKKIKNLKTLSVYRRIQAIYRTILSYCLNCRKNTEIKNPKVVKTKNGRIMVLSTCKVCKSKKSKYTKGQETSGLLSSLGIKKPLSTIPLAGPLLL